MIRNAIAVLKVRFSFSYDDQEDDPFRKAEHTLIDGEGDILYVECQHFESNEPAKIDPEIESDPER